jgi:hypothetical protein
MNKGFMFTTDAMIGLATVIIATLILTLPYSIEEGSEANISFIKRELPNQAVIAYYQGKTATEIGLSQNNADFNNFDYAECIVLYDYNHDFQAVYGQGNLIERKYCMGKRGLR